MHRKRVLAAVALVVGALLTAGCEPKLYRAETVLGPDGRVSRAIYQPDDATPAEAQKPGVWSGSTYAPRIEHKQWTGGIDELPPAERSRDRRYFAAWGEFESPAAMPQAFVKKAPSGLPDGKLVVDYQREDFGLVVEYRWTETLTDIVTIDDMHRARQELADLVIPLGQKILDRALGDEYDTTKLVDWFNQSGRAWFFDMTDVVFAAGARGQMSEEKIARALAPVCARHGLALTDATGKLVVGEQSDVLLARFARQLLHDNLRRRDGQEVPAEVIEEIVQWLELEERPENSAEQFRRYEQAAEAVIAETFGGSEKFDEALGVLVTRLLGLYAGELFGFPHHFQYTLKTPGPIVKTNGTLLSDRSVRWTFEGLDAYPFGYAMECESLAAQSELESQLLGRSILADNAALLKYVELARSDEALRQALVACAATKSLQPFYEARDRAAPASTTAEAFDAMSKFLKLSDATAGK